MSLRDVSVRPAETDDADTVWAIQRSALAQDLAAGLGGKVPAAVHAQFDAIDGAAQWRETISKPPAKSAVVVATRANRVVGYGAMVPLIESFRSPDGHSVIDAEISALDVRAADQRQGHGSRLLSALMDYASTFGHQGIATWGIAGEASRTRFLTSAGFTPLGLRRALDVGGTEVEQVGWYTTTDRA